MSQDGVIRPDVLLADILDLRDTHFGGVLDLLGELQKRVQDDIASGAARAAALEPLRAGLQEIAGAIATLERELDAVVAPLRLKLREVESWFDTVMQSFEERYTRGMKTYAFAISLSVAILLKANVFGLNRDIVMQPEKRAAILALQKTVEQSTPRLAATVRAAQPDSIRRAVEVTVQELDSSLAVYRGFGFTPLMNDWNTLIDAEDWAFAKQLGYMLLGWLVMAALLSVGAPFWQDALDSVFGVKNLLRKRADLRNVEHEPGTGQPRP